MNNKDLIDKSSGISYEGISSCTDAEQMVLWNEKLQLDICSLQNQIENAQGVEA